VGRILISDKTQMKCCGEYAQKNEFANLKEFIIDVETPKGLGREEGTQFGEMRPVSRQRLRRAEVAWCNFRG